MLATLISPLTLEIDSFKVTEDLYVFLFDLISLDVFCPVEETISLVEDVSGSDVLLVFSTTSNLELLLTVSLSSTWVLTLVFSKPS